jgi:hypothetical protein
MTDRYPPAAQREALLTFAAALKSAATAFRRDQCGDPWISGARGHVHAIPGGFALYCVCETKQAWTWAKKALAFAKPTEDGDEEGTLFMDRAPTPDEAESIRRYLGIRAKPELDQQEVERRRQLGERLAKNRPPAGSGGSRP